MKNILFLFCLLLTFILCSCSAEKQLTAEKPSSAKIKNSIIYMIHGDASYLYHDTSGTEIHADERMVKQAIYVAENSPNSEVFIIHIKPGRKFLFLLPLKDREIFHFQKGKLISRMPYHTDEGDRLFEFESNYYKRFSANSSILNPSDTIRSMFLFYGHQIPEFRPYSYNASHPGMNFNIEAFADALEGFKKYADYKFDMVVLSSCNNATPGIISKIAPISKFIIASPGNLHLSHINSLSLIAFDSSKYPDNRQIAARFAESAFDSLKRLTRTEITISIFESERIIPFLNENENAYKAALEQKRGKKHTSLKCVDCNTSGYLNMTGSDMGVFTYYRQPEFGKQGNMQRVSGWGCWK